MRFIKQKYIICILKLNLLQKQIISDLNYFDIKLHYLILHTLLKVCKIFRFIYIPFTEVYYTNNLLLIQTQSLSYDFQSQTNDSMRQHLSFKLRQVQLLIKLDRFIILF